MVNMARTLPVATVWQLEAPMFTMPAEAGEGRTGCFSAQGLRMIVWALSQRESLIAAWSLFEHVKHEGQVWQ